MESVVFGKTKRDTAGQSEQPDWETIVTAARQSYITQRENSYSVKQYVRTSKTDMLAGTATSCNSLIVTG